MTATQAPPQQRVLPTDLEAEFAVLGAILLDPGAIARVLDQLVPEDFYREGHRSIYRAARALFGEGRAIDNVAVAEALSTAGALESAGGRARLAELQESVPTAANIEHHARIVRDKAEKRALIEAGQRSMALGYDPETRAEDAVRRAQEGHFALSDRHAAGADFVPVGEALAATWERVADQAQSGGQAATGIKTGFKDLDRLLAGIKPGNLTIVAGATSMGKTSFAMQVATRLAVEDRVPVAVFSLEMSRDELVERMLCEQARVDAQRLKRGTIGEAEFERLSDALAPLSEAPLYICDAPSLDDLTFRIRSRQVHLRRQVGLIVVDYLQLMRSKARGGDRVQEVSAISHALKAVARELDVPVLALSQLSRAPAGRPDKRPVLSDLRESGSIEMDADLVVFVYRDDYYNREKSEKPGIAEVIVAKHRNGPTGTVELLFQREYTRFADLERRQVESAG